MRSADALSKIVLSLVLAGVVALALREIVAAPLQIWNDVRLARVVSFVSGNGLYTLPEKGAILGNIWGPFFGFYFLPAAMFSTPTPGLCVGVAMAIAAYFIPALFVLLTEGAGARTTALSAFAFFSLFTFESSVLRRAAFGIHPDPVALGFAMLACAAAYTAARRSAAGWLIVSAIASVLTVAAKQMMVPVPLAIASYLWAAEGRATFLRYTAYFAVSVAIAFVVLALSVDFPAMWHNAVVVPGSQPWREGGGAPALFHVLRELAPRWLPFFVVVVACAFIARPVGRASVRDWLRGNGWLLVAWVALACLPTSVVGRVKAASSLNHLSYTLYFVVIAALLALLRVSRLRSQASDAPTEMAVRWLLLAGAVFLLAGKMHSIETLPAVARGLRDNPEATAFEFVRDHAGQVFLPSHPLVTLLAEGRAYHSSIGIEDQELAGIVIDEQRFRARLPPDLRYVLVRDRDEGRILKFLPEFSTSVPTAELPGWTVLVKDGSTTR